MLAIDYTKHPSVQNVSNLSTADKKKIEIKFVTIAVLIFHDVS